MANTYEVLLEIGGKLSNSYLKSTSGATKALDGIGKSVSGLKNMLVGAVGALGVGLSLDSIIEETGAAEGAMSQLNAVLKSTGDVSGVSQKQAVDLADSFSGVTEFSKDTTLSAEDMLLTFTNIGKDVFPTATSTVLDMSQALGQDTKSSAIQFGKALNDPINGITALKRVGVTFTAAQKDQITAMVKAGNTAGAQKVILQELNREFGNSAKAAGETLPGQLDIAKNTLKEVEASIGEGLLPTIKTVMPVVISLARQFGDSIKEHQGDIKNAVAAIANIGATIIKDVAPPVEEILGFIFSHGKLVVGVITGIAGAVAIWKGVTLAANIAEQAHNTLIVLGALRSGALTATTGALTEAKTLELGITGDATVAQWGLNAAMIAGAWPILAIVAGVALLAVGVYELVKHWGAVSTFFKKLWGDITKIFFTAINAIVGFAKQWGPLILSAILPMVGIPLLIIQHWKQISAFFVNLWNGVKSVTESIGNGIKDVVVAIWNGVVTVIMAPVNVIKAVFSAISNAIGAFKESWTNGFTEMQTPLETLFAAVAEILFDIRAFFINVFNGIKNAVSAPFKAMVTAGKQVITGIKQVFGGFATLLKDIFVGPWLLIFDAIAAIFTGKWGKLKDDATKLLRQMTTAIRAILQGLYNIFVGVFTGIKSFVMVIVTAIIAIPKSIFNAGVIFIKATWTAFSDEIKALWNGILTAARTIFNALLGTAKAVGSGIVEAFNAVVSFFRSIPGIFQSIMNAAGNVIRNVWNAVIEFFRSLPGIIGGIMSSIGNGIRNVWDGVVSCFVGLPGRLGGIAVNIGSSIKNGFTDAINFIKNLPAQMLEWGKDMIMGLVNGIKNAIGSIGNAVLGVANTIRSFLHFSAPDTGPLKDAPTYGPDFVNLVGSGIKKNVGALKGAAKDAANAISDGFNPKDPTTSGGGGGNPGPTGVPSPSPKPASGGSSGGSAQPVYITYSPQYTITGASKEDVEAAQDDAQGKFNQMMKVWQHQQRRVSPA